MEKKTFVSTRNACKLCAPFGSTLVFKGIEGALPFIHGSQGCATYIRRYMISHFREPVDIASSSLGESATIFGGRKNLSAGLKNVMKQYNPKMIGIATNCLSETIGENIEQYIKEFQSNDKAYSKIPLVGVSAPSYKGTHQTGFHEAVRSVVKTLVKRKGERKKLLSILPGFVSCEDLRHLKEILEDFGLDYTLLPDYSETLDGVFWNEYRKIPEGGTPIRRIKEMGMSKAVIELGKSLLKSESAGSWLSKEFDIPYYNLPLPIGIQESDRFFKTLEKVKGFPMPEKYKKERGRLLDAYIDGHKYLFGKKAVIYGDEDFVASMASFVSEIGVIPVLCASGEDRLKETLKTLIDPKIMDQIEVLPSSDFMEIAEKAEVLKPDVFIGSSKGYFMARKMKVPLMRAGFPIHDRMGGQRMLHLGYKGTQMLFDRLVNIFIEVKQETSPVGYSYI
ncbi:MAG: nitrogenase [Spirochaetes bacterium GWB1_36_13]|nr:MAG: nitrogenase [Spirochaetes bacterium GWB1_36_13]